MKVALVLALVCTTSAAAPSVDDDQRALAYWHQLAPTWQAWRRQRKTIPHELERALARAVLRGGNFACPVSRPAPAYCSEHHAVREPAPSAGFDDPCMRRVLATWALRMLSEDEVAEISDGLIGLATLPVAEAALTREVIDRVGEVDPERALPLLVAAGDARVIDPIVFARIVDRLSPASQQAARAAHLYKSRSDASRETAWLLEEAADPLVDVMTRAWAVRDVSDAVADGTPFDPATHAAMIALGRDPDCEVAMLAIAALAAHGDPSWLPKRPLVPDPASNVRAVCLAMQDADVVDRSGASGRRLRAIRAQYHLRGTLDVTHQNLIATCRTTHCEGDFDSIDLLFSPAPDGGLYLPQVAVSALSSRCLAIHDGPDPDDYAFELEDVP